MSKQVTKAFRVDEEAWAKFEQAAKPINIESSFSLARVIGHIEAAISGIQSGMIKNFDGDIAELVRIEFPQLTPFQLQAMANVLLEAAKRAEKKVKIL